MMIKTQTSSFQMNNQQNSQINEMLNTMNNLSSKSQNKLKIAIKPQNEYQVYSNTAALMQMKDQIIQPQSKKQQQIIFQQPFMKGQTQVALNKSNANQGISNASVESNDLNVANNQGLLKKKSSCIGLAISTKAIFGNDKVQSPQLPLTAKESEQKQINFYFASKKNNINKRTIFKFNDKLQDNTKKAQNGYITTADSSPKLQQNQKQNAVSLTGTSRSSMAELIPQDKRIVNYNQSQINCYFQTENTNRNEQQLNNKSKGSVNSNQLSSTSSIFMEFKKLQGVNQKYLQKIQELEKLCLKKDEELQEKEQLIAAYQSKQQEESNIQFNSANSTTIKSINSKNIVKTHSILQNNIDQVTSSINNSFQTNDKKFFTNSTAQMSASLIKSPHSPQRNILQNQAIQNIKQWNLNQDYIQYQQQNQGNYQNSIYSQSTNDLTSPKPSKHKAKLLSINLQQKEVKEMIKNLNFNQQQSPKQRNASELYSQNLDELYQNNQQILKFISPEKQQLGIFNFQMNDEITQSNQNQEVSNQDKIQEGLKQILERVKNILLKQNKNQV